MTSYGSTWDKQEAEARAKIEELELPELQEHTIQVRLTSYENTWMKRGKPGKGVARKERALMVVLIEKHGYSFLDAKAIAPPKYAVDSLRKRYLLAELSDQEYRQSFHIPDPEPKKKKRKLMRRSLLGGK